MASVEESQLIANITICYSVYHFVLILAYRSAALAHEYISKYNINMLYINLKLPSVSVTI